MDIIDENVHFGYNVSIENRRLVSEPGFSYYSAIAYAENSVEFIYNDTKVYGGARSTATFIDETTVLSCAHTVYKDRYIKNENGNNVLDNTSLINEFKFYPGVNSYPNKTGYFNYFGEYIAYETFVPISYRLCDSVCPYDWSISLTTNTIIGTYNHSYMGLSNFNLTGTETNPSLSIVQFAGYPGVVKEKDENNQYINTNNFTYTMWTSYPLINNVYGSGNYLLSNTIISSGGNSGCPWFTMNANVINGVSYYYIGIIGVHHGTASKSNGREAYSCRIRPSIINIYKEIINYEN